MLGRHERTWNGALGWAIQACIAFGITHIAYAQLSHVETDSALTKLMVAEAGWTAERDHTSMLFAIARLDEQEARSSNILETLAIHVGWWELGYPPKRPWIAGIDTSCEKPEGFPGHLNWQRHRHLPSRAPACLRMYGIAV